MILKFLFYLAHRFLTSRDKAFKRVVNDTSIFRLELPNRTTGLNSKTAPESKCPELLANYCDMLLRKTPLSKKLSSDEVESKLRDVLLVLKYVQNKDVFMRSVNKKGINKIDIKTIQGRAHFEALGEGALMVPSVEFKLIFVQV